MRTIFTHATLILPDRTCDGSIIVEGDRIAEVLPGRHFADGIDLRSQFLSPGLIDIHTDYLERELHPRPESSFPLTMAFEMMDRRAISCGVTTVFGAARVSEETSGPLGTWTGNGVQLAEAYQTQRESALGRHYVHVRWDPVFRDCAEALDALDRIRPVLGNLVFNDSTPGERQFKNTYPEQVRRIAFLKNISLEQAEALFEERRQRARGINNRALVQQRFGGKLPLGSHDDTTVEHVREAHHYGATLAEMPVTLEAAREAKRLGMQVCMGAPNYFRGGSHCGNLSCAEAMAEGLVDLLCSDYHFPSMLGSAARMIERGIAPHEALRFMTAEPARHLNWPDQGSIAPGRMADLIVFSIEDGHARVSEAWVGRRRRFAVH